MGSTYIKVIYTIWSRIYPSIDKLFAFDRKKTIGKLNIRKTEKILEIGVGTGLNFPYYPACTLYGIDCSKSMISRAHSIKSNARVHLKHMDAEQLQFPNNFFDKAIATYVLRVCPHPHLVLKEVSRVLKPKGIFVIVDEFKKPSLFTPLKIILGWGRDYTVAALVKSTEWEIMSMASCGRMNGTVLIVLKKVS